MPHSEVQRNVTPSFKKRFALIFTSALVLLGTTLVIMSRPPSPPAAVSTVTIAFPGLVMAAPLMVADAQGLFQKAHVKVAPQRFVLGKDALKSVLDGKADLAIVADTPYMFALMNGSDIGILAGVSQSRRALAIVTRSDRGIQDLKHLTGKTVGLTQGTNLTYFFDAMLQVNGIAASTVTVVNMKTDESVLALKAGRIDAAALFQPYLAQLEADMGAQVKVFYGEDVYAFRFLLVGKSEYIEAHPEEIRRILRALIAATQSIRDDPASARRAVGEVVKLDQVTMLKIFDPADFAVSLDQAMLLALEDQTRWAMQRGLVKAGPVPNYLTRMKYQALEAELPTAVKIVH